MNHFCQIKTKISNFVTECSWYCRLINSSQPQRPDSTVRCNVDQLMNDEPIYPEAEFVYDPPPAFDRLSKFGMSETS